ncbi:MAG: hypothetical protein A2Z88_01760, partial [Omnitrophica WOR_2 bacterium GWA2_47_8]
STPKKICQVIIEFLKDAIDDAAVDPRNIKAIGIGVPGIVSHDGNILESPNIPLAGFPFVKAFQKTFKTRIFVGNDVNLGLLGEKWKGVCRNSKNIISLFLGTGIGGAIVLNGELYIGEHGAGAELGHVTLNMNGPKCTCGNKGCLEAHAGRWAIERDIHHAIRSGKKTVITESFKGGLKRIKSKMLSKALSKKDRVVTHIITQAVVALGHGCISFNHMFNPEMIVLGGGVMEACGGFILPIIRKIVHADPFFKKLPPCKIVESQLGDDAVILGAVAMCKSKGQG